MAFFCFPLSIDISHQYMKFLITQDDEQEVVEASDESEAKDEALKYFSITINRLTDEE